MVHNFMDFAFYIVCLMVIISIGICGIYAEYKNEIDSNLGKVLTITMVIFGISAFLYMVTDIYITSHQIYYLKDFINL